jgi:hypothetical protein
MCERPHGSVTNKSLGEPMMVGAGLVQAGRLGLWRGSFEADVTVALPGGNLGIIRYVCFTQRDRTARD